MSSARRERFLAALTDASRARLGAWTELDAWLERSAASVSERGLALDEALLVESLARVCDADVEPEAIEVGDLVLASHCARGDAAALQLFAREHRADLDRAISKSPSLGLSAEEFRQLVLDRLFVHEEGTPPRILKYLGRGPLRAWVRVMASRFVIDLSRRKTQPAGADDGLAEKLGAADDTELDYLRHAYGPALDAAFEQAVASLTVRERNLLRQRYLHEISADKLATMYDVHRSTLFAWLDKARASLLTNVRRGLAQQLPGDQLESVVGMLGSKLQLSVRRMLDSRLEMESK